MFVCHDPPIDGVRYLSADLSVTCFSGAHLSTAAGAVAVLAGYALGFPAVVMAVFRGRLRRWRPGAAFLGGNPSTLFILALPVHVVQNTTCDARSGVRHNSLGVVGGGDPDAQVPAHVCGGVH